MDQWAGKQIIGNNWQQEKPLQSNFLSIILQKNLH